MREADYGSNAELASFTIRVTRRRAAGESALGDTVKGEGSTAANAALSANVRNFARLRKNF